MSSQSSWVRILLLILLLLFLLWLLRQCGVIAPQPQGKIVFVSSQLFDGSLDHAIDVTELGTPVGSEARVWTNTTTGGQAWDNARQCAAGISSDESGIWTWTCGAPGWTAGDCRFQSGKYGDAHSTSG